MLFSNADSLSILEQVEKHRLNSSEGTAVQVYLVKEFKGPARHFNGHKKASTTTEVRSLFTLFDSSPTNPRITVMLKPAHRARLLQFGKQPVDVCGQILNTMG